MIKINKLKARMMELEYGMEALSAAIGINVSTLYRKLRHPDTFYLWELQQIQQILNLDKYQIFDIFFDAGEVGGK